ncbi:MAG: hypothetical protein KC474_07020 [Cyanobacteria bacterium HKST-UBA04]|nr:hypothetical protein [Cyanobacteria bacterium HKST-UBA04]
MINPSPKLGPFKSLRVVMAGYGPLGQGLLKGLLTEAISTDALDVVAVVPWVFDTDADGQDIDTPRHTDGPEGGMAALARAAGVPVWSLDALNSLNGYTFIEQLMAHQVDVVLVGSWGEILKPHVLNLPGCVFVNCHPALLPRHRGPNPYTAAIRDNDSHSGITFHLMDEGIDTGPVLWQSAVEIEGHQTGGQLRLRCAQLAQTQVAAFLHTLATQGIEPVDQDRLQASQPPSYDKAPGWADGQIDWTQPPEVVLRHIRALDPWVPVFGRFANGLHMAVDRLALYPWGHRPDVVDSPMAARPGEVVFVNRYQAWVGSADPGWVFCAHNPRLTLPSRLPLVGEMVAMLLQCVRPYLLRPGTVLVSPLPKPGVVCNSPQDPLVSVR